MGELLLHTFVAQTLESLQDPSFTTVALGSLVFGALAGLTGTFVVISRLSLVGDVLAHAAVPGMALLWLATQPGIEWALTVGAIGSISLAWVFIDWLKKRKFLNSDAALSCTLALFFGLGLVLLSKCLRLPGFGQIGIEKLFLGSIATVLPSEIRMGSLLLFCFVMFLVLFWSRLWPILFDSSWNTVHKSKPFSFNIFRTLLAFFMVISIALAMRILGILLLMTLCVTPAILARHLVGSLWAMCFVSAALGALFCLLGGAWSAIPDGPPTGPAIVLVATFCLCLLCLFNARIRWRRKVKGVSFDKRI